MEKVINVLRTYLEENTSLMGAYNGGGDEDNYLCFEFEKVNDRDLEHYSKDKLVKSVLKDFESEISPIIETINSRSEKYLSLIDKIQSHQYIEDENGEFIENPDCDLLSIGELVLTELNMWM